MSLYERLRSCDAALRTHLDDGEQVVAIGRCEDVTDRGGPERGGAGWTFVMITNTKLRWVPRVDLAFEAALELRHVTAFAEYTQAHRYSIALKHPPLTRPHTVPAHASFVKAGKAVFTVEYKLELGQFCPQAADLGFNSMKKGLSLRVWRGPCP